MLGEVVGISISASSVGLVLLAYCLYVAWSGRWGLPKLERVSGSTSKKQGCRNRLFSGVEEGGCSCRTHNLNQEAIAAYSMHAAELLSAGVHTHDIVGGAAAAYVAIT
jgi:hypothetical protein